MLTKGTAKMPAQTKETVVKEMFEYVYAQSPSNISTDRHLSVEHFTFLAEKLKLSMEDLSLYVLAYFLDCTHVEGKFDIKEQEFVSGLVAVLPSTTRVNAANGYAPAFDALRKAVEMKNMKIRSEEKELARFYEFLYTWCLKSNKATDRTMIASELWSMFFTTDAQLPVQKDLYKGYKCFKNIAAWTEFIASPEFTTSYRVSMDLWNQLRRFASIASYEKHNPEDAWPIAIDNFVEWFQGKNQPKGTEAKDAAK